MKRLIPRATWVCHMQQKPGAGLAANAAQWQRFVRMLKAMMQMLSSFSREAEWSTTKHLRNLEWLCADARHAVGKFFISSVVSLSTAAGLRHSTTETHISHSVALARHSLCLPGLCHSAPSQQHEPETTTTSALMIFAFMHGWHVSRL